MGIVMAISLCKSVVHPLFLVVLMLSGIVAGRVGAAAERPPARGKLSKTGSKTGPPDTF